jgi:enolase-phosphatase E1
LTPALLHEPVRSILLDIEGTTTPLAFVSDVLFPYARSRAEQFVKEQISSSDVGTDIAALHRENLADAQQGLKPPPWDDRTQQAELASIVGYIHWLMARDRKSTPLKSLQGRIWQKGYATGELRGEIFPDVSIALRRWHAQQRRTCIFSSGSAMAQRLLFANSVEGDLTPYLSAFFDTTIGGKSETQSYRRIVSTLQQSPAEIAFLSDVAAELDAARSAGLQTLLCQRPGNRPQPENTHPTIHSFDQLLP